RLPRVRRDVPPGRAAAGLLPRSALGLDRHADRDLRYALAAAAGLPDDLPAARRPLDLGGHPAAREEHRGVRPWLRRELADDDAVDHPADPATRPPGRLGAAVLR